MWSHMWNWGGMVMMILIGLLFLALIVVAIVAIIFAVRSSQRLSGPVSNVPLHGNALEILKERYARGEITREEYQDMRRDLEP
jgi:putative membrane protein